MAFCFCMSALNPKNSLLYLVVKDCGIPQNISNAELSYNQTIYEERLIITCDTGYYLNRTEVSPDWFQAGEMESALEANCTLNERWSLINSEVACDRRFCLLKPCSHFVILRGPLAILSNRQPPQHKYCSWTVGAIEKFNQIQHDQSFND